MIRQVLVNLAWFILGAILCGILSYCLRTPEVRIETDTIVKTDTLRYDSLIPMKEEIVKYTKIYVRDTVTEVVVDSVEIPVTQKVYADSSYTAWVSGYEPTLDSIEVYQRERIITNTVTIDKKRSRIGIGVHAGYGYGFHSRRLEPYVGIGFVLR